MNMFKSVGEDINSPTMNEKGVTTQCTKDDFRRWMVTERQ